MRQGVCTKSPDGVVATSGRELRIRTIMPQSKTNPDRARKLKKRRARNEAKTGYTYMLDVLRESLNNRFYEEQGFPHLEILAQNMQGCEV